jgi:predicted ATPase/DNA-binding NarL/FixJ family response regulator
VVEMKESHELGSRRPHASIGNLPAEVTPFTGRRLELADARQRFEGSRLLTLTGLGGVGKTRLALRLAADLGRLYRDGVWLVELAELSTPDLLTVTVMRALGVPVGSAESRSDLISYLRDKQALIVLDNCEHLVDPCAKLADAVLHACPHVRILATSREPLRVWAEVLFRVPTLSFPAGSVIHPGDEDRYDAIRFFAQRVAAVAPDFKIDDDNRGDVAELCRQLDGLPLAIELAAVRVRSLSVRELLARQHDRYRMLTQGSRAVAGRHETLRAAMDWSYELCTESERALWARLSVFSGGIDLDAAETVCADGESDVLAPLAGLVDKSVLSYDGTLYRMLGIIREYGADRLRDRGEEAEFTTRHRDYCAALARRLASEWFSADQVRLWEHLGRQHANLRSALDFCLAEPGQAVTGLRLATDLWSFWIACGHPREGRQWLDRLLDAVPVDCRDRGGGLWVKGHCLIAEGRADEAIGVLEQGRDLARSWHDSSAFAHATYIRGFAETFLGDADDDPTLLEAGLGLEASATAFNPHLTVAGLYLGIAECCRGRSDRAIGILDECRATCAGRQERWIMSWSMLFTGVSQWAGGNIAAAEDAVREALRYKWSLGDPLGVSSAVDVLAWIARAHGQNILAAELLGASRSLWKPLGNHMFGFAQLQAWSAECLEQVRSALSATGFERAFSRGAELAPEQALALAMGDQPAAADADRRPGHDQRLTRRESQVAVLIAQGMSNKQIAEKLVVSVRTVEGHVLHVMDKYGFSSRAQIAAYLSSHAPR